MLERTHFAYASGADACALVTGPETVAIWSIPLDESPDEYPDKASPDVRLETSRSRIEGAAFVGPRRLLTVHQLGECVVWEWPARDVDSEESTDGEGEEGSPDSDTDRPEAKEVWSRQLDIEFCAFASKTDDEGFARAAGGGGRRGEVVLFVFTSDAPRVAISKGHDADITRLVFDPHGYRLASGGRDRHLTLWSTDPETFRSEADGGAESDGDSESTDTTDDEEFPRLRKLNTLEGSRGWPLAIAFSHDESRVASTALDNALYLWDPAADEPLLGAVNRHHNWVTELAFSPDDTCLVTGSWDSAIGVFESESLAPTFRFDAHTDFVSGLAFVPGKETLLSVSYDGSLAVWNWKKGELVDKIRAHADWVEAIQIVGDNLVFTVSSENVVRLWDIEAGEELCELGDASFEGFELGRDVDFSDYVDVPELSSEKLEEQREPTPALESVHRFGQQAVGRGESSQTAVGMLEEAIDTSSLDAGASLDGAYSEAEPAGTAMLDSQIEDDPSAEGSAAPPADDIDDVDAAFAEISDVEIDGDDDGELDLSPDIDVSADSVGLEDEGDENEEEESDILASVAAPGKPSVEEISTTSDEESVPTPGQPLDVGSFGEDSPDTATSAKPGNQGSTADAEVDAPEEDVEETLLGTPSSESGDVDSPDLTIPGTPTSEAYDTEEEESEEDGAEEADVENEADDGPENDRDEDADDEEMSVAHEKPGPSSAAELKNKLKRLREKKRAADGDAEQPNATDEADETEEPARAEESDEQEGADESEEAERDEDEAADEDEAGAAGDSTPEIEQTSPSDMWGARPEPPTEEGNKNQRTAALGQERPSGKFQLRHAFMTPHGRVSGLTPQPEGDFLATCGEDGSAALWTLGGRRRMRFTTEEGELNDLVFTRDGRVLAAASEDGSIHLWLLPESPAEEDSSIKHTQLDEHDAAVTSVDADSTGKYLLSGSTDGTARIWSLVDGACMAVLEDHGGEVLDVSWGQFPVTVGEGGVVRYWDEEGRKINETSGYGEITSVATLGAETCWTTQSGSVYVQRGGQPVELHAHDGAVQAATFGDDGVLVTAGTDETLYIYEPDENSPTDVLRSDASLRSLFIRQNLIGAGGDDGRIYLFSRA